MSRPLRFFLPLLALLALILCAPLTGTSPAMASSALYATPSFHQVIDPRGYRPRQVTPARRIVRERAAKQRQLKQRQIASVERRRIAQAAKYRQEMRRKAAIKRQAEARRLAGTPVLEQGIEPEFRIGAARQRVAPRSEVRRVASLGDIRQVREEAAARHVEARVDIASQRMIVKVDGEVRHVWKVSTGRKGFATPRGAYRPGRMHASYFSRKYYNSPMPYSIFFRGGYAIHGTNAINRLGGVASHGCVRLATGNARTLFNLVRSAGSGRTRIVIT
jgi:lipoprotein-anchoring transpeptidase ErfK/SrfK